MEVQFAVAGLITVAAITPGPNNFIVLEQTLHGGWRRAAPAIAGVVAGTQLLLLVVWLGVGVLIAQEPRLQLLMTLAGAGYLVWLGVQMIWRSWSVPGEGVKSTKATFTSFGGLVLFQFLNPKSWVLVLTATAAHSGELPAVAGHGTLLLMFLVIPASCLLIWAFLGIGLKRFLAAPTRERWFDRGMGALLVISAGMLFK